MLDYLWILLFVSSAMECLSTAQVFLLWGKENIYSRMRHGHCLYFTFPPRRFSEIDRTA